MNLVGKILTVLILVMSMLFAAFAMALYSAHENWRLKSEGLAANLTNVKQVNQELKDKHAALQRQTVQERKARDDRHAKLITENRRLSDDLDVMRQDEAQLKQDQREAVTAMDAAEKRSAKLLTVNTTLQANLLAAERDRDASFKQVVQLTDDLHNSVNEMKRLNEQQVQLGEQLDDAKQVLLKFNLQSVPEAYADQAPADSNGVVLDVPNGSLVEVSIGSDDGLRKGHQLLVTRDLGSRETYVGQIEVVQVQPDRVVCKIVQKQSPLQKGDRVVSQAR